ncbi:MAG: protein-glutamine glutaminase family protein, partial [Pseudobdellovibrio sp.]
GGVRALENLPLNKSEREALNRLMDRAPLYARQVAPDTKLLGRISTEVKDATALAEVKPTVVEKPVPEVSTVVKPTTPPKPEVPSYANEVHLAAERNGLTLRGVSDRTIENYATDLRITNTNMANAIEFKPIATRAETQKLLETIMPEGTRVDPDGLRRMMSFEPNSAYIRSDLPNAKRFIEGIEARGGISAIDRLPLSKSEREVLNRYLDRVGYYAKQVDPNIKFIAARVSTEVGAASEVRGLAAVKEPDVYVAPKLTSKDYRELEMKMFKSSNTSDLFSIDRGSPAVARAESEGTIKALNDWPTETANAKRLSGLDNKQIKELYAKVENNETAGLCNINKYDPNGEIGFCFGRATTAHIEALRAGISKDQVRKVWAVGHFKTGSAEWRYHVTTIVRNTEGRWIAIDPIFDRPIPVEQWYKEMQGFDVENNMRLFSTRAERFGPDEGAKYTPGQLKASYFNNYFKDLMEGFRRQNSDLRLRRPSSDLSH